MTHEVKPLRITFTCFPLCYIFNPFFFVVVNILFMGLVQCIGCEKVNPGLAVYSVRDLIW